jgi:sirohydrochlorin cobaltochelatase
LPPGLFCDKLKTDAMKIFRMDGTLGMGDWKKAGLLLVGHGSSRGSGGEATLRLAGQIREKALFVDVQPCFWRREPLVSLDLIAGKIVYVVPNFAGEGKHTQALIPERLGLIGRLTQWADRCAVYCDPVGCHPGMADQLSHRALELCQAENLHPRKVSLLLIAHGSKSGSVNRTPEAIAMVLRTAGIFGEIITLYLEQEPRVDDWPRRVTSSAVIAAPLLISEGMHASEDLPPLFGLSSPSGGPSTIDGRQVWLLDGIGRDPAVVAMILDQVRAADTALGVASFSHQAGANS